MSKFEPVHRARHMNVCKYYPDVSTALKYPDCFIGVGSFNDLEACILDRSDRGLPN